MILTLKQAAAFLSLHRNTVYKLAQTQRIPATKVGSQWRFEQATLEAWISQRMHEHIGGTN